MDVPFSPGVYDSRRQAILCDLATLGTFIGCQIAHQWPPDPAAEVYEANERGIPGTRTVTEGVLGSFRLTLQLACMRTSVYGFSFDPLDYPWTLMQAGCPFRVQQRRRILILEADMGD